MGVALNLAKRGLGRVAPNPAVGCVLVKDGHVVGRGWTQPGGRPHAETEALMRAGEAARGATAYVTLEPCAHHGETPPCAEALIKAGVARVVTALRDPDPRVDGGGHDRLRRAGIEVVEGVRASEAEETNLGFLTRVREGRPAVTLKLATSLDGRIATASGESKWITGEQSRRLGHLLRAEHDAIMVGSGTALADDPELTCRVAGLEDRSPIRVVVDGKLALPATARLVVGAREIETVVMTGVAAEDARYDAFLKCGVSFIHMPDATGDYVDLNSGFRALAARGINSVLVEGGGGLASALLDADLVDRVVMMRAGIVLGGDGRASIGGLAFEELANAPCFTRSSVAMLGSDVVESFRIKRRVA